MRSPRSAGLSQMEHPHASTAQSARESDRDRDITSSKRR
jgi:hypothetical protein